MAADPTHDHEETQPALPAVATAAPACVHRFAESREPCPHPVPPEATRCVWHNAAVTKGDAYVARLVAHAAASARGDLAEARLAGLHAPGIRLAEADLRRADLRDAVLDGADLRGARLAGASLRRASLKRVDLTGADLSGADLAGTNFGGAVLDGAALRGATIDGTVFKGASAVGTDLAGADLRSLRYDRRSRLAQATGLPPELAGVFDPVPAEDDDPAADESRVWARGIDHPSSLRPAALAASDLLAMDGPNGPPTPALRRRGPWPWIAAAAMIVAIAGTVVGAVGLHAARAVPQDAARLAGELAAALSQADANLLEVRRLQGLVAKTEEAATQARTDAARAQDEAAVRRAEAEDFRKRLSGSETERARLRDADDRAELMALRLAEASRLAREQAEMLSRQERVGGILAEGVRQLRAENEQLAAAAKARQTEDRRADLLAAELATVKQELEAVRADREALATRERRLTGDLAESRSAIQAYLARIAEADLGHVLGDDAGRQPLVPVRAGTPIALAGDFLVSLRLDPTEGGVAARLVVQRPTATANPDVSIVLYDADQKPLRRLGFGFPHIDRGAPFASASATVACDRFPAFARVIVSPAATPPVGAR